MRSGWSRRCARSTTRNADDLRDGGEAGRRDSRDTAQMGPPGRGGRRTQPGMTTEEPTEIKQLKQENAELRRARSDPQDGPGFLRGARPPTAALMRLIDGHNSAFRGRPCLIGRPLTTTLRPPTLGPGLPR